MTGRLFRSVLVLALTLTATLAIRGSGLAEEAGTGVADINAASEAIGASGLSRRFLLEPRSLRVLLRRRGTVLLSAQSTIEIANPGFVNDAVPIDVDAFTAFSETPDAFSSFAGWAERFGALGITRRSTVIVYDDGELKFASRVRFLLDHFGLRRAFLLDGGFKALQPLIANGQLSETPPGVPTLAAFDVKVQDRPIHLVDRQTVASVVGDPSVILLDVRTPAEFAGCFLLPNIKRGGHIPGAINLPLKNILTPQASDADFSFLNRPGQLRSTFVGTRLHPRDRIIVYCHDGAMSSLAAQALVQAGYKDVSLYYLSYLDWQDDESNPVESIGPCN